ncbi:MAG: HAD family phosphatase [Burkholderiales bacterium]|nr:HAD family phosphatase [Burkholderiales bacterium]
MTHEIIKIIDRLQPKLFIFDCDGTVMDTLTAHYKAWNATFAKFNLPFITELEFMTTYKGMNGLELVESIANLHQFQPNVNQMLAEKNVLFDKTYSFQVKPFADIIEIINHYYNKIPMSIASNGCRDTIKKMLKYNNLEHIFELVIGIEDVSYGKPNPEMFLLSANKLNVAHANCLIFEDSEHGFTAATLANMNFIDVPRYRN